MGARRLRLTARRVDGADQGAEIRLARPGRDPMRLRELFQPKLAGIDAGFGIDALRLAAPEVEPLKPAQLGQRHRETEATRLADLVSRLGNRIGFENVLRFLPAESHVPERAQTIAAAAHSQPEAWSWTGPPRPIVLFAPEPVRCLEGSAPAGLSPPLPSPPRIPIPPPQGGRGFFAPGPFPLPHEGGGDLPRPAGTETHARGEDAGSPPGATPPSPLVGEGRVGGENGARGERGASLPPPLRRARPAADDAARAGARAARARVVARRTGMGFGLRDYWQVETAEGPRLWLFHTPADPGADPAADPAAGPAWYAQGLRLIAGGSAPDRCRFQHSSPGWSGCR